MAVRNRQRINRRRVFLAPCKLAILHHLPAPRPGVLLNRPHEPLRPIIRLLRLRALRLQRAELRLQIDDVRPQFFLDFDRLIFRQNCRFLGQFLAENLLEIALLLA